MNAEETRISQSERLYCLMNELDMDVTQFAKALDMYESNVKSYIKGTRKLTEGTAEYLSKALGVSKEWLLRGDGEKFINKKVFDDLRYKNSHPVVDNQWLENEPRAQRVEERDFEQMHRLKKVLSDCKLSHENFIKKVGLPRSRMNNYLAGKKRIAETDGLIIAKVLGVSADWLLNGKGSMLGDVMLNTQEIRDCLDDIQQSLTLLKKSIIKEGGEPVVNVMITGESAEWLIHRASISGSTPDALVNSILADRGCDDESEYYPIIIGNRETLSKHIEETRNRMGLSLTDFAKMAGITTSNAHNIEEGITNYSIDLVIWCLQALNSSIALLKEGSKTVYIKSNKDCIDWIDKMLGIMAGAKRGLADYIGRNESSIWMMIRNYSNVAIDTFLGAAKYFGYTVCIVYYKRII